MLVLGIDPSSTKSGAALVETDTAQIVGTWVWFKDTRKGPTQNLYDYFRWLTALISSGNPEQRMLGGRIAPMASIEYLSVERNAQTTRLVSHFQAVSALACKQAGMMVIEGRVRTARKIVLGDGSLSKDEAWEAIRQMYPEHSFRRKPQGGDDEADAVVMALAGPQLAEL
jgi:Holliday junction resolvasome RuvABC endonuclease subunit